MLKKLLALLLAVTMSATLLSGCGGPTQEEDAAMSAGGQSQGTETAGTISEETKSTGDKTSADNESTESTFNGGITEINVKFFNTASNLTEADRIVEKVNAIAEAQIGVHANIEWIEVGQWNQQISLALSSNEAIDLIHLTPLLQFNALTQQNQLMDITDLLTEYAPGLTDKLSKTILSTTLDGKIYGLPLLRDIGGMTSIFMDKNILNELDLVEKAENMSTWAEYEEILTAVKSAYPDLAPLYISLPANTGMIYNGFDASGDTFAQSRPMEPLGDQYNLIDVDTETNTVVSWYESDDYAEVVERLADWYKKGLVYKDGATSEEESASAMANNICFSYITGGETDQKLKHSTNVGRELTVVKLCDQPVSGFLASMFGYAVPYSAAEPEAAVKFINLLYTNEEINNLLSLGEEGIDYVVADGMAKWPEGVTDMQGVGYHSADFLYGNQFITLPWEGQGNDWRDIQNKAMAEREVSKYLGCTVDTSSVTNEITACYNAAQEFTSGLSTGNDPDWENSLEKFKAKLQASGIEKIIACYQEQLNAWLAGQ